jgi:hypothetical protein
MDPFIARGVVSNLFFALILIACLFLPAGNWNYWQGWVFLVVFELCAQAFGIYFLINDRKVIERRVRVGPTAEREPPQKIISALIIRASSLRLSSLHSIIASAGRRSHPQSRSWGMRSSRSHS